MSAPAMRDVVASAVDLYVHASPDLLARRCDDLALAAELRRDGLRAAVHRHHFSQTAERARLASDATGFELLGAVLLNDTVGGFDPTVVDMALRMGARWIGLPTLSARRYRPRLAHVSEEVRRVIAIGPGDLVAVDASGALRPEVHEVLGLAGAHGVVLDLGYLGFDECLAVLRAAREHRVERIVLTNPLSVMGLSSSEIDAIMAFPEVALELTAYSMYPRPGRAADVDPRDAAGVIRRFGAERCALSSDTGSAGAPSGFELLSWACGALAAHGLDDQQLQSLVRTTPSRLLGIGEPT